MLGSTWYFQTIRKYIAIVGHLVNNLSIERTDANNNVTQVIAVPVEYLPKENMMVRLIGDPNISRPFSDLVPRITYALEPNGIRYRSEDRTPATNYIAQKQANSSSRALYQFTPTPYDFGFKVLVWVKNFEDGTKIIEQILPFFAPEYTVKAMLVPEINEQREIPVELKSVAMQDLWSDDFKQRQYIVWELDFNVKGFLYGPVKSSPLILFSDVRTFVVNPLANNDTALPKNPVYSVVTQPGLTANGEPTSNLAQSIAANLIFLDSDYGYIVTQTDYLIEANTPPVANSGVPGDPPRGPVGGDQTGGSGRTP